MRLSSLCSVVVPRGVGAAVPGGPMLVCLDVKSPPARTRVWKVWLEEVDAKGPDLEMRLATPGEIIDPAVQSLWTVRGFKRRGDFWVVKLADGRGDVTEVIRRRSPELEIGDKVVLDIGRVGPGGMGAAKPGGPKNSPPTAPPAAAGPQDISTAPLVRRPEEQGALTLLDRAWEGVRGGVTALVHGAQRLLGTSVKVADSVTLADRGWEFDARAAYQPAKGHTNILYPGTACRRSPPYRADIKYGAYIKYKVVAIDRVNRLIVLEHVVCDYEVRRWEVPYDPGNPPAFSKGDTVYSATNRRSEGTLHEILPFGDAAKHWALPGNVYPAEFWKAHLPQMKRIVDLFDQRLAETFSKLEETVNNWPWGREPLLNHLRHFLGIAIAEYAEKNTGVDIPALITRIADGEVGIAFEKPLSGDARLWLVERRQRETNPHQLITDLIDFIILNRKGGDLYFENLLAFSLESHAKLGTRQRDWRAFWKVNKKRFRQNTQMLFQFLRVLGGTEGVPPEVASEAIEMTFPQVRNPPDVHHFYNLLRAGRHLARGGPLLSQLASLARERIYPADKQKNPSGGLEPLYLDVVNLMSEEQKQAEISELEKRLEDNRFRDLDLVIEYLKNGHKHEPAAPDMPATSRDPFRTSALVQTPEPSRRRSVQAGLLASFENRKPGRYEIAVDLETGELVEGRMTAILRGAVRAGRRIEDVWVQLSETGQTSVDLHADLKDRALRPYYPRNVQEILQGIADIHGRYADPFVDAAHEELRKRPGADAADHDNLDQFLFFRDYSSLLGAKELAVISLQIDDYVRLILEGNVKYYHAFIDNETGRITSFSSLMSPIPYELNQRFQRLIDIQVYRESGISP